MALANTLTGLIPTLYAARDVVSRELTGLIPAVTIDAASSRAALNQTMRVHVTPQLTAGDITPSMTPPTPNSVQVGFVDMAITKMRQVQIPWSGEEKQSINENGPGVDNVVRDQLAQAMRTLANEIEADLAGLFVNASRAVASPSGGPFSGTDLGDSAKVRKILDDNGAPLFDRQLVINTNAGVNLRTQTQLTKANEAATDATLRRGTLLDLHGFAIRESAQIKTATKGTGASYTTNTAGYAIGATAITLITGTGTVLAGDRVTFAGDTANVYIVETGVAAPGVITLAKPGLRVAIPASATALTVGATNAQNLAFQRSALILLARAPYLPGGKDMANDRMTVTDPNTGLPFEVALYEGYHAHFLEVSMSWGVRGIKSEHTAILLGAAN
jgi:hypothetical protein